MMCNMKIEIIKQRRRTISLKVLDSENAILKVPFSLSEKRIKEFLLEKQNWLEKTAIKLKKNENFAEEFQLDKFIYLKGQKLMEANLISFDFDQLSSAKKKSLIRKYYSSHFFELSNLVEEISEKTNLKFAEIRPTNSVRVWGSFNSAGVMKLNWKLVILPQRLVEYVIIHELCHGKHMNHSPKFWGSVAKFCPNYKKMKKELGTYGFLLKPSVL